MTWFRTHPYASALWAAGILVVIGALVVQSRSIRPAEVGPTAWGGEAVPLLNPVSYQSGQGSPKSGGSVMQDVQGSPPYTYIPPAILTPSSPSLSESSYDFDAFVAMLIKGSAPQKQTDTSGGASSTDAYAYIPRGLIGPTTIVNSRTDLQQALYDYGNDIGSSIESLEQQYSNAPQILKEQAEDRTDSGKAGKVVNLGRAFQDLGNNLLNMDTVPSAMTSAHNKLAQSYVELGKNLSLIPGAERDSDFIAAIQVYNASADTFTRNYIQIASLFGAHGVTFTSGDSGRVFTFSPSGF